MKRLSALITAAVLVFAMSVSVMAADKVTYTFKGNNVITDGSPNDITDVPLTDKITVTTSGDMNRKYAAITDLKHNNEAGTFPANDSFKATGSYIYLACANANDNAVITLNMPEIKSGSKVTLTFAKPTVTNNGTTLRNTNDPYAYLKIADRYISINGDNFDTWRTESVVTGEDTDTIEFRCDKWGAVCISKIEISDGGKEQLYSVNIASTQYANLNVNGIKFCADENGKITLTSHPAGEKIKITAYKDGYETYEMSQTMPDKDIDISIPLNCLVDAAYYESDFGNAQGTLALDGEFNFGDGIEAKDITKIFGRLTFTDGGYMTAQTAQLTCKEDGIYLNDNKVTSKDNIEFELYFDKGRKLIFIKQNDEYTKIENADTDFDLIKGIEGRNAALEYIGVAYPDTSKITIEGPDKIASLPDAEEPYKYTVTPEYMIPDTNISVTIDNGLVVGNNGIAVPPNSSGKATITASYNGAETKKVIEIKRNSKISSWHHDGNTLNLHSSKSFTIDEVTDEYGNLLPFVTVKDFKSSDESVIKIDENGMMTAVGKGKAAITANAYTGADNIISVEYTVDEFYISGVTENNVSYAAADIIENDNYYVTYEDGTQEIAEKTPIPAATVTENGLVLTANYQNGKLVSVRNDRVKKGDKIPVSNGSKRVYLFSGNKMTELKDADTTTEGFKLNHAAGELFEIAPAYTIKDVGDVKEGKTLDVLLPYGLYSIGFKKAETWRGDIYVNGYMVGNNVDQSDADRKVTDGAYYMAEDIPIRNGQITVLMTDGSTLLDYVYIVKKPDFYDRPERVYIIGDSLVCSYYGDFEKEVGGGRTGWGQVIDNYLTVPVTNLANSGQFAKGLYETAFPSVIENGKTGDICLIECGYNDRSYSTREEMTECVKSMIQKCREKGIVPILVTPNASQHDYKPSVVWSSYLRDIAVDTSCDIIDLSKESYNFLYSLYGDNEDGVITKNYNLTEVGGDTLHSSYAAAHKWASIVAGGIKRYDITNSGFTYTFTDTLGNQISAKVK